jgi:hypothetical protein
MDPKPAERSELTQLAQAFANPQSPPHTNHPVTRSIL